MPSIRFIEVNGKEYPVEAEIGTTVMRAATDNGVPGIIADCGGAMTCGTCHVYVADDWLDRLPQPSSDEQIMIECVMDPEANSRLSCQLEVTMEIDGLVVYIPKAQF